MRIPEPLSDKEVKRRIAEIRKWSRGHRRRAPLDALIVPLVAGLIRWRVRTLWSCAGHAKEKGFPYVSIGKEHAARALYLAYEWSEQKAARFEWAATQRILRTTGGKGKLEGKAFHFFNLRPLRPLKGTSYRLKLCQKDAVAFGKYLLSRQPK